MADMAATSASMIGFDYKADMVRCRAAAEKSVLIGNVDPSAVMALGTLEQVLQASRQAIELVGKAGRFILSPTAGPYEESISPRMQENYLRFLEAGVKHGERGIR